MFKKLIYLLAILLIGFNLHAQEECLPVKQLKELYNNNSEFRTTINSMFDNIHALPNGNQNPWKGKTVDDLYDFLNEWFYFLPNTENGLDKILKFTFLYHKNPDGMKFVLTEPGLSWTNSFVEERGKFMDSPESATIIKKWLSDNSLSNEDFVLPPKGFDSFNDFFIRDLKPGTRPIHDATDESILVSPVDGIINMLANELELETEIPTKGRMTMSLNSLLDNSKYAEKFIGGSALTIFLMPNNYHHYHSPTTGSIVESNENVGNRLFGMPDLLGMLNNGNIAYNKDYSVFEDFKHGYFIIKTNQYGFVAMIPIGLNTVGSVVFEDEFTDISDDNPKQVFKGDRLGHFKYGGSTVLLIFEKGKFNSMTIEQGQRIGKLKN